MFFYNEGFIYTVWMNEVLIFNYTMSWSFVAFVF